MRSSADLKLNINPPAYAAAAAASHPGPLCPGKYWLGQPDEKHHPDADHAPSTSALSVTARRPLEENSKAEVHLCAIGDGPWPNQIWTVQATRNAYILRNEATNSCLNYVDGQLVLEAYDPDDPFSVTEWVFKKIDHGPDEWVSYYISPKSDHKVVIGAVKGESFNKGSTNTANYYYSQTWGYCHWRLESVSEEYL
ncbi:hypothetical protein APHAL10511_004128 [Amanita phalloides]|nr:hypothetical protein APHAL10511_004128 [Amanita phalloides]